MRQIFELPPNEDFFFTPLLHFIFVAPLLAKMLKDPILTQLSSTDPAMPTTLHPVVGKGVTVASSRKNNSCSHTLALYCSRIGAEKVF